MSGGNAIGDVSAVTVAAGAVLLVGADETIGSLSGAGQVAAFGLSSPTLTIGADDENAIFSGSIAALAGGLTKIGAGTQVLSGASTHAGATTVNGGTLQVDGSIALSTTTVNGGATLAGSGSLADVIVAAGGTLAPGSSAGELGAGSVEFAAGATFAVELGGTTAGTGYDRLTVTGTVDIGGATLDISLIASFLPAAGQTFTIIDNDGGDAVTGTFAGLDELEVFLLGGRSVAISYAGGDGNDVVLTAIANDPPAGTDKTVTVAEDGSYVFTAADFGFGDFNDSPANALAAVKISSLPAAGSLLYNNVAVTAAQVAAGFEVSAADIASGLLRFAPAAQANGTGYASFTFQVRDNGGTASGGVDTDQSPNTITINVTAVNDPPPSGVTIIGTKGADLVDATHTIAGQPFPTGFDDHISGRGGNDRVFALGGDDVLLGGKGKDVLRGDEGNGQARHRPELAQGQAHR